MWLSVLSLSEWEVEVLSVVPLVAFSLGGSMIRDRNYLMGRIVQKGFQPKECKVGNWRGANPQPLGAKPISLLLVPS